MGSEKCEGGYSYSRTYILPAFFFFFFFLPPFSALYPPPSPEHKRVDFSVEGRQKQPGAGGVRQETDRSFAARRAGRPE